MFADDTTLYTSGNDLNTLLTSFKKKLEKLFAWCNFNKLDINWSKTFFMFITNKRINKELPTKIQVDNISVDVVTDFKLLGITIDNKLNFEKYTTQLRAIINRKLYSIKRIFYLNRAVKLQFFKTFILPYFDYCLSLFIYFPKASIQRINNAYYICLDKLFKFKMEQHDALNDGFCDIKEDINESNVDLNPDVESSDIINRKKIINKEQIIEFNALLTGYNLDTFQFRIFKKLMNFSYNIIHREFSPPILKDQLRIEVPNADNEKPQIINNEPTVDNIILESDSNMSERSARINNREKIKKVNEANDNTAEENSFDRLTFYYFFSKFCSFNHRFFSIQNYNLFISSHSNEIFKKLEDFSILFNKFNLPYVAFHIKSAKKRNKEKKQKEKELKKKKKNLKKKSIIAKTT
jgi:hypothetical protein